MATFASSIMKTSADGAACECVLISCAEVCTNTNFIFLFYANSGLIK